MGGGVGDRAQSDACSIRWTFEHIGRLAQDRCNILTAYAK